MKEKTAPIALFVGILLLAYSSLAASPNMMRLLGNDVADTVERVMPSVVVIRTESVNYHIARDFFGFRYRIPERLAGQGSGVIITKDGYVITSHHVVSGASSIEVILPDERSYPAELIGNDPQTDLAVLKITANEDTDFPAAEIGDSDKVRPGEFAIAVGSPFSLASSVTLGIVSQKGRSVGQLPYEDFIQTDAPINPGNSGGPLINADGEVIGINAMIQRGGPGSTGNIGIGFAVPSNLARRVAEDIMAGGQVNRPWIGILPAEPGEAIRALLPTNVQGLIVRHVFENSPAAKSGLREGDVIIAIDGQPVQTVRELQRNIFSRQPGDTVTATLYRHGGSRDVSIETEAMPNAPDGVEE